MCIFVLIKLLFLIPLCHGHVNMCLNPGLYYSTCVLSCLDIRLLCELSIVNKCPLRWENSANTTPLSSGGQS